MIEAPSSASQSSVSKSGEPTVSIHILNPAGDLNGLAGTCKAVTVRVWELGAMPFLGNQDNL
jgi:hypothetical protein